MEIIEAPGDEQVSLRSVARRVGIAATSVYLHFPDVDHLLAAVVQRCFRDLTEATTRAASQSATQSRDPLDELRRRCRGYCHFALEHPKLYQVMFEADLPPLLSADPDSTPGRQSFANLVATVRGCIESGAAPPHDDPFRLASLIWTAEHGLVLARISRPAFPWAPLDALIDEMIDKMMGLPVTSA
jgi:AcrR family transcriptional regulator